MHVTHLYHSGFLIEFPEATLLFDWYPQSREDMRHDLALIRHDKKLYVFVSHSHHDHYCTAIWDFPQALPRTETTFIVDAPVAGDAPGDRELDIVACEPEQIYTIDDNLEVTTLNSTDLGLAFCVNAFGKTVYHAGDLSVWWWPNRDVRLNEYSEASCSYFLEILEGKHIDLAMLPITPRAGSEGNRGIELFMKKVGADIVLPMHYADMREQAVALVESPRLAPWRDLIHFDEELDL